MLAKYIREAHADYRRVRRRVPLGPLRTEAEYDRAVAMLDAIIDEIGEQETHPLTDLVETLALAVSAYEEVHVPIPVSSGPEILRALMEDHGLSQSDLPEVGSQGVVSEILSGKRDLNVQQIARLAARFEVSPAVFLPMPTPTHHASRRKRVRLSK